MYLIILLSLLFCKQENAIAQQPQQQQQQHAMMPGSASPQNAVVLLDSTSFNSQTKFETLWNMFYPWGRDHNGSARMYKEQVSIIPGGVLQITAKRHEAWEGKSTSDPKLRIFYHSGAVHLKEKITVSENKPRWVISGDFQVPSTPGTWPAFWITGAASWPPESDIMEFKGTDTTWQNTATGPDWKHLSWQNKLSAVPKPQDWHNYKIEMKKISSTAVSIEYFIDGLRTDTHLANFVGKPFWLIINMQMEGDSGTAGKSLQTAEMRGRNIYVAAYSN
ncbi:LamG domain-containing protein [Pedobacter caeni]|nr:glycoside hydrolase [Pedobacter caeni]